jgi:hypothetical protein
MAEGTARLAEVKLVLDLLESQRASKAEGWTKFRLARTAFAGAASAGNWARLAKAADNLQAALAEGGRTRKPTPPAKWIGFNSIK